MAETPKKLSELSAISAEDISPEDLLLVSDYDSGTDSCVSKKMTMAQIVKYVSDRFMEQGDVQAALSAAAVEAVNTIAQDQISAAAMHTVEDNLANIADLLDGKLDGQIYINAGDSVADGQTPTP